MSLDVSQIASTKKNLLLEKEATNYLVIQNHLIDYIYRNFYKFGNGKFN